MKNKQIDEGLNKRNKRKKKKIWKKILIMTFIVILIIIGWFAYKTYKNGNPNIEELLFSSFFKEKWVSSFYCYSIEKAELVFIPKMMKLIVLKQEKRRKNVYIYTHNATQTFTAVIPQLTVLWVFPKQSMWSTDLFILLFHQLLYFTIL